MATAARKVRPKVFILVCVVASLAAYLSNGRLSESGDSVPASLIPVTLLLDHTVMLNMFAEEEHRRFARPYWLADTKWGTASVYPVATGILSVPIYLAPVLYQERLKSLSVDEWRDFAVRRLQKIAAAVFAALSVGVFYSVCAALGFRLWLAILLTCLYAFGSEAFSISSQGLWQHGPGCLALLSAIRAFLALDSRPRTAALLLSLFLGVAVAIRENNLVIAAPIGLAALYSQPRLWLWLLLPSLAILAPVIAYNDIVLGSVLGIAQAQKGDLALSNIPDGLLGSLFSPARGLFLYFPAALLALILVILRPSKLLHNPLQLALGVGIILTTLFNASYFNWYGGHSFGPRYFTEIEPLILILLGTAIAIAPGHARVATICLAALLPYSVFVQYMGTFNATTIDWNATPNVDQNRWRLWDWSGNPIFSGLRRGPRDTASH